MRTNFPAPRPPLPSASWLLPLLILCGIVLPLGGNATERTLRTHEAYLAEDGAAAIPLGKVTMKLTGLAEGLDISNGDLLKIAARRFHIQAPRLEIKLEDGAGNTPESLAFREAPKAKISVTYGDTGLTADGVASAVAGEVVDYSLGAASICEILQGNPIHIGTGNKLQSEPLFSYASPGRSFAFGLTYNSQRGTDDGVGMGWSHPFLVQLEYGDTDGLMYIRRADGKRMRFERQEDGGWLEMSGQGGELQWHGDGRVDWFTGDTRHRFDERGVLVRVENLRGHGQSLTYGETPIQLPGGQGVVLTLHTITDDFGGVATLNYDDRQRLRTITDPADQKYALHHDEHGNLTAIEWADGARKQFHYADPHFPHHLTAIIDEAGRPYARFEYDAKGRGILSAHGEGAEQTDITRITYLKGGERIVNGTRYRLRFINNDWTVESVEAVEGGKPAADATCSGVAKRTFYPDGRLATVTDPLGRVTSYSLYDRQGRPGAITEQPKTAHQRITRLEYHPTFNRPLRIIRPGSHGDQVSEFTYDAGGNPTVISTTAHGPGAQPAIRTTRALYDDLGRPVQVDGARTDVADITRFAYYPNTAEQGANRGRLKSVTGPDGQTLAVEAYDPLGRVTALRTAEGHRRLFTYDTRGNLLSDTTVLPDGTRLTTTQRYDASGLRLERTDSLGRTTRYHYTSARALAAATDPDGNRLALERDAQGRTVATTLHDPQGQVLHTQRRTLDAKGRLRTAQVNDRLTRYTYDAADQLTEVTDAAGRRTQLDYDPLGRLTALTDPAGGTTVFAYDRLDQLTRVTDPIAVPTQYLHHDLGERLREDSRDRGTLAYAYDESGLLKTKTDALGNTTAYRYDVAGRVVESRAGDTATRYTYDAQGRPTRIDHPGADERFGYDANGRLASHTRRLGDTSFTVRWDYDPLGRPTAYTLPGGQRVRYRYADTGRLTAIELESGDAPARAVVADIRYDSLGRPTRLAFGNGRATRLDYDGHGRLAALATDGVLSLRYAYDPAGNISSIDRDGRPETYAYDPAGRLVAADTATGAFRYAYDANGNRLHEERDGAPTRYRYQDGSNRLAAIETPQGSEALAHDPNGNLLADGRRRYAYDPAGHLVAVSQDGLPLAEYAYNAAGQRISKTVHTGGRRETTYFLYDGHRLSAEIDAAGTLTRQYLYLGTLPLALLEGGRLHWLHPDALGTPQAVTGEEGKIVWRQRMAPFGQAAPEHDPDGDGNPFILPLRFPGQYFDQETGLHYNGHRYYNPHTGRYTGADPIGLNGGGNLYLYALGDPLLLSDPLGLEVEWEADDSPASVPVPQPWFFGTYVHSLFSKYVRTTFADKNFQANTSYIGTENVFSGLRPDAIDVGEKQVWELKPYSYNVDSDKYLAAQEQVLSYVNAARMSTGKFWRKGDSAELLKGNATLDVGFVVYFGKTYNIRLHQDSVSNSGLLFYTQHQDYCPTEKTVMQQILEALAQMKPKYIILPGLGGMPAPAL